MPLVIFIITTPQLTNNLKMSLPSVKPRPEAAPKPKIKQLFVDEKGQTYLNRESLTLHALRQKLEMLHSTDADLSVVVQGTAEVDHQNMAGVPDLLQLLRFTP